MDVPLFDLKKQYALLSDKIRVAIEEVCASQNFILGQTVSDFEEKVGKYIGANYSVGVTSGSDALIMALMAEKIGPGDEVITTPFTFFATAGAIARVGATPVFVDIEPNSFTIDASKILDKVTDRTKAIIPVHLYGQAADMRSIMAIANRYNLIVIEDCAQAIGAQCEGQNVGTIGDYGCFSFFPTKNLGGFGDGGLVTCKTEKQYEKLKAMRNHGSGKVRYHHEFVGGNFRLDALQAAILSVKLDHLNSWTENRQTNAAEYASLLGSCSAIELPKTSSWCTRHVCNQFVIRVKNGKRDELADELAKRGVGTAVYYPLSLHLQECFAYLGGKPGDFPVSEKATEECLALPIFPELTYVQRDYVAKSICEIFS